jgi:hypothetical protein
MIPRVAAALTRILILSWMTFLIMPAVAAGQTGLSSGLGQVVLVARSAPRGSIESVGIPVERAGNREGREIAVAVRVSANTAYRLSVIRCDPKDSPYGGMQVQGVSGEFQRVERGTSILVALGQAESGTGSLTVVYRMQPSISSGPAMVLPIRYELAIAPQL